MIRNFIFCLLATAIFVACNSENKHHNTTSAEPDTLTYHFDTIKASSKYKVTDQRAVGTTSATIIYPEFENQKLNTYLEKEVSGFNSGEPKKASTYQEIADDYIRVYDEFYLQNKNSERPTFWYLNIKINVVNQEKGYIALACLGSDFSGGAHPNSYIRYLNYDPQTDQPLTLESWIAPEKRVELLKLAESIFRKNENLAPAESLAGRYFFENDKFALAQNFYVSKKGLVFLYNPYEIKPYVAGTTELLIPFGQLKGIAKPNSILTSN